MITLAKTWADHLPVRCGTSMNSPPVQQSCTEEIEEAKEIEELEEVDVVGEGERDELEAAIEVCRLQSAHTSNRLLFKLARLVRGIEKKNDHRYSPYLLSSIFQRWEADNMRFLRPEHDYYCEFLVKLTAVRHAWGEDLGSALETAYRERASVRVQGIKDPDAHVLANLCRELQWRAGTGPFYLDGRACAQLLGRPHSTIASWLRALQVLAVIKLHRQGRPGRASRYHYIARD